MKPEIFAYLDFRLFLKDAFEALKAQSPRLSYRTFAKKAGFSSPNFLQQVIQGQRSMNSTYAVAAANAFKLNKQETDFFQDLVGYGQSRNLDEKNLYYQRILKNKRHASVKAMDKSKYDFYTHWYIPVVRELLIHPGFDNRNEWISERIFPRITATQVESARALLERLDLVRQDSGTGKWHLTESVVTTESEATSLALRNYHMSAIQLAHDSLKTFAQGERDIRSVTIGLSETAFIELKTRLETVWKEVLDFAGMQTQVEKVYQVNLQLFPLMRERKGKDD